MMIKKEEKAWGINTRARGSSISDVSKLIKSLDESRWVLTSLNESQWVLMSVNEFRWVSVSLGGSK